MKRLVILSVLILCGCCDKQDRSEALARQGGRVIETRNVIGYTIVGYADGTAGFYWDEPILGFAVEAGCMHDVAVALEEVSYNAIQRQKSDSKQPRGMVPRIPGKPIN